MRMTKTIEVIKAICEDRFASSVMEFLKENNESLLAEIKIAIWPYGDDVERSVELLDKYAVINHVFIKDLKKDFYRLSTRGKRIYEILKEKIGE